jgi:hypothetical protein
LGIIISVAAYALVAPLHPCENPPTPGRAPAVIDGGAAAQLSAARHLWEENVQTFLPYNTVQQALMKNIITVFKPMSLEILNDNMVGFAKNKFEGDVRAPVSHLRQNRSC